MSYCWYVIVVVYLISTSQYLACLRSNSNEREQTSWKTKNVLNNRKMILPNKTKYIQTLCLPQILN